MRFKDRAVRRQSCRFVAPPPSLSTLFGRIILYWSGASFPSAWATAGRYLLATVDQDTGTLRTVRARVDLGFWTPDCR